jgi:hypothetical protein
MSIEADSSVAAEYEDEITRLRKRVASLESQLLETEAWANRVVAEAQDKTYWLDRWHLDLNALMRRRGADRARAAVRAVRAVYRAAAKLKRQHLR